ncbi:MAG: hypothetical protein QXY27_03870 [Nitrososphaerota archaeon]
MGRAKLRSAASIVERVARSKIMSADKIRRIRKLAREAIIETLSMIRAKPEYLIWRNPAIPSPVEEVLGEPARSETARP